MRLKDFKIIAVFFFCAQYNYAQNATIQVLDVDTSDPIAGVNIFEDKNEFIGFTDVNGVLVIDASGKISLTFQSLGYITSEENFDIGNDNQNLTVSLLPLVENLNDVVIIAKKKEDYALTTLKPVEGTHIYAGRKSEVVNLDLIQGNKASNNPRQVFSKVAGLNIYDSNDGGLQLNIGGRGLDPNRTANFNTRQNDYDISADVLGYPESYYTPPTEGLEKIQVIRGAASLQYGTQFGGLINFITKSPVKNKPIEFITRNTLGSYGTFSNFTSLSGTVKKFGYYAYYNGKTGDGFRPNSDYDSDNYFVHLDYQFNDKTDVAFEISSLNYLAHQPGGLSDVQFLEDPTQSYLERNWFDVDWKLYNFKINHNFNEVSKLSLSLFALDASRKAVGFRGNPYQVSPNLFSTNADEIDEDGNYVFERDLLVGNFNNYGAEARFLSSYTIADKKQYYLLGAKIYKANNSQRQGPGSTGADADFNFVDDATYPNQNDFDFPNFNASIFGEHIFNVTEFVSLTPGFRFEHIKTESKGSYYDATSDTFIDDNNLFVRNFVLFGLGVSYKPITVFELYGNISQNYRSVTFSDIRTVNPSFLIDENITDEKGFTADLGVRGRIDKSFSYDANVFALYYNNRIGQVLNDRAQWVRKNTGTALIYGLESLLQWSIKETYFKENNNIKFDVFSNLAITESVYLKSDEVNVAGNEVEYIPRFNLKTGVSFGWKNLLSSLQYTFVSEQFTDVTNSPYDPENNVNVIGAIPSYDILDLSLSYKFSSNFRLESGINNLLDNSYFTRRATGYPGPGIIPATPRNYYATLEIKF
ncbi:TonB-dependent receptor [Cellulophaga baltica]|uniref:TonB-dependent receptor domain-containing protein n=1 Tax=Cellulophaga TaxID=104264 RepID=UPI001C066B7C|nr:MULTISPECIES: TonB-dependent receptor [Cellulophaga]MBU2996804.1 TonB-dependent receptor [Cellulophaga baltica]MDO6768200.1 TonB-dependent receptor [Cellulophaga sp. 1_MG-2023]